MKKILVLVLGVMLFLCGTICYAETEWQTIKLEKFGCSYEIPKNCDVTWHWHGAPEHEMVAMQMDTHLMTGVILVDLDKTTNKKYVGIPRDLAVLPSNEKEALINRLIKNIEEEDKDAHDINGVVKKLNGQVCVIIDGFSGKSRSISYIFVSKNKFVSVDYIYDAKQEKRIAPIVRKSISTFKM